MEIKDVPMPEKMPKLKMADYLKNWHMIPRRNMERDKTQEILEEGLEKYEATHSVCCDYPILNGICTSCKEGTASQKEWDDEHKK